MKNKRVILFIVIIVLTLIAFLTLSFLLKDRSESSIKSEKNNSSTSQIIKSKVSKQSSEDFDERNSDDNNTTSKDVKSELDIEKTMSVFVSQKLTTQDVDDREKYLKNTLTESAFNDLQVALDSTNVKKMISDYEKNNQFSSSSKSILANKDVTNVAIYQNVSDKKNYYVEVKYSQTSPVMPNETLSMIEKLNIKTDGTKVSSIIVLSIETSQSNEGDNQ